jgi:hypothetical protein
MIPLDSLRRQYYVQAGFGGIGKDRWCMAFRRLLTAVVCLGGASLGCSAEVADGDQQAENVDSVEQATYYNHGPSEWIPQIVGMANVTRYPDTYTYYDDGWACWDRDSIGDLCQSMFEYSAKNNDYKSIRGIAYNPADGLFYTWYSDSTVSKGTAANLNSGGNWAFTPPPGVGGSFSMSQLLDTEILQLNFGFFRVRTWNYYWKIDGIVYRTTGSYNNGGNNPTQVNASSNHGSIKGITHYVWDTTDYITYTYYSDGKVNSSRNDALNLAAP